MAQSDRKGAGDLRDFCDEWGEAEMTWRPPARENYEINQEENRKDGVSLDDGLEEKNLDWISVGGSQGGGVDWIAGRGVLEAAGVN